MTEIAKAIILLFGTVSREERKDVVSQVLDDPSVKDVIDVLQLASFLKEKLEVVSRQNTNDGPRSSARQVRYRLVYDSPGTLSAPVREYKVSVTQFPGRRFTNGTYINGIQRKRLTMGFVEQGGLRLYVNRKITGENSETLSRTIYRHLVDRYNSGDETVSFEPA
jgi:hypothetical protein